MLLLLLLVVPLLIYQISVGIDRERENAYKRAQEARKQEKEERLFTEEELKDDLDPKQIPISMMLAQMAALFLRDKQVAYVQYYVSNLMTIGFSHEEASKLFLFDCRVVRRWNKRYLTEPNFTRCWFFNLQQKFFTAYPSTKEDILKERFFTISELCKLIDEAEWHFWNSHEREMPPEIWQEICDWRLKGPGGEFAIRYFEMVAKETGIPVERITKYGSSEGSFLSFFRWM